MTDSKHMPGPWLLGPSIDSPGMAPVQIYDGANPQRCIAAVYPWIGTDGNPDQTHDANARLVAAAPELLEALRIVHVELFERPRVALSERARKAVRAAIAKAEGRTHD